MKCEPWLSYENDLCAYQTSRKILYSAIHPQANLPLSLVARKPASGCSDNPVLKPTCSSTETSQKKIDLKQV